MIHALAAQTTQLKFRSAGLLVTAEPLLQRPIIRWKAISGALALHKGIEMPREFGPHDLFIAGKAIAVSSPARA